ncbi:MAG: TolC family protein [Phycisphaerales bacterium]|nr:TolC family protein [Phycisphaerales bacterium]
MRRIDPRMHDFAALCLAATSLAGCVGTPIDSEKAARSDLESVRTLYRPGDARPTLPSLTPESPLADYLRYAMLNNPRVEAAYYSWAASIERIAAARSLPDPRLTFEADITDTVETVMPGLMLDLPGPGKLRAAGDVAAAESRVGYFAFEGEVLRTAYATKSAYIRLHFLSDTIRVQRETLDLLREVESQAQQQVGVGRGTIQDVLRAQIDRDQLANQIANLEDSRSVLEAEFRAALGHAPSDGAAPIPTTFEAGVPPPPPDTVLAIAAERNPVLRQMEADVRRGEAMLDLARTSRVPDFTVGIEADVKASPVMWRPTASMTLPIWRDKIAAEIAAAQGERRSSEARLSAEHISVAAELASMLYMYRESGRNATLFGVTLLPRARQSLDAARSGYASGRSSFLDVIDAERQLLEFELSNIEARTQQELAIASISLVIAGVTPEGAPVLPVTRPQPAQPTEARP